MQNDSSALGTQPEFWLGRSGQRYVLSGIEDRAAIKPNHIYALAEHGVITWAGTAESLLADPVSREKFRRQDGARTLVLSLAVDGDDEVAIMTLVWDLEGSRRIGALHAA